MRTRLELLERIFLFIDVEAVQAAMDKVLDLDHALAVPAAEQHVPAAAPIELDISDCAPPGLDPLKVDYAINFELLSPSVFDPEPIAAEERSLFAACCSDPNST
eukprot:gb/GFBE01065132.1/.p1 GENE.gb/GFBE01065132.1/~~gb/GFBE01065132.1/.p1  ORF type:complete len:104 (+),score=23.32 gb/GFBE01065132.1/:1-312(+)